MINPIQTQKDYQVLAKLGQGLSSDLYKCIRRDPGSNFQQIVTLKKYKSEVFRKKFHNELENLSRINCEGIPKVLDWSYEDDRLTLVTEYVDGCDMHQFIKALQFKQLEVSLSLKRYIIQSIYKTLKVLQEAGVCHGDLKPSNVLLSTDGKVKLIDICLGDHGLVYATPEFSAPEVLAGHRPDFLSDMYSLGLLAQALEVPGYEDLMQIKPGLRSFKKASNIQESKAAVELSAHVWNVKYKLDTILNEKSSIGLQRPILSLPAETQEQVQTQELAMNSSSYKTLSLVSKLKMHELPSLVSRQAVLRASLLFVLSMLLMSSGVQSPFPALLQVQFRSLKSFEVWDKGRWNSLPYDFKSLVTSPKKWSFKMRSHKVEKPMKIYLQPYEQKIVEIDAL